MSDSTKPAVKIETFWAKSPHRSWVTVAKDADGNQIGDASYDGDRTNRDYARVQLAKEHHLPYGNMLRWERHHDGEMFVSIAEYRSFRLQIGSHGKRTITWRIIGINRDDLWSWHTESRAEYTVKTLREKLIDMVDKLKESLPDNSCKGCLKASCECSDSDVLPELGAQ